MIQTLILVGWWIFEGEFQRKWFLAWPIYRWTIIVCTKFTR
jgi:hypothetical protein